MTKLPVFKTAIEAYTFVFKNLVQLFRLVLPGVAVCFLVWAAIFSVGFPDGISDSTGLLLIVGREYAAPIIAVPMFIMYSIAWHRFYLAPDEQLTLRSVYRWRQSRETRYLWAIGILFLVVSLFWIPIVFLHPWAPSSLLHTSFKVAVISGGAVVLVGIVPTMVLSTWALGRLSLALPSAAIEVQGGIREGLKLTAGTGWRLFAVGYWLVIPLLVTSSFLDFSGIKRDVSEIARKAGNSLTDVITTVEFAAIAAEFFVGLFTWAVVVTALSIAYRHCTEHRTVGSSATTQTASSGPVDKLPAFVLSAQAYSFVWREKWKLLILVAPGLLLYVALTAPFFLWGPKNFLGPPNFGSGLSAYAADANLAATLVAVFCLFVFTVAWLRHSVGPQNRSGLFEIYRWSLAPLWKCLSALARLAARALLYSFPMVVLLMPLLFSSYIPLGLLHNFGYLGLAMPWIFFACCTLVFLGRYLIALPAAANGQDLDVERGRSLTRGNVGSFYLLLGLAVAPFGVVYFLLRAQILRWLLPPHVQEILPAELLTHPLKLAVWIGGGALQLVIITLGIAVLISALAATYRFLDDSDT